MLTGPDDVLHQSFVDFVTNQGLSQLINFPTRGLNVLDILLTDEIGRASCRERV